MAIQSLYEITHWNAVIIDAGSPTPPDVSPAGVITDLTLPTLEREVDTTKRAGELGVVPRPKFFNEMELTFTVKSVFSTFLNALAKGMQTSYTIRATACLEPDTGAIIPYIVESKGFTTALPLGGLSEDGFEAEYTMMAWYLSLTLGSFTLIYDPRNYIYSINGVNLFANAKAIIEPPLV